MARTPYGYGVALVGEFYAQLLAIMSSTGGQKLKKRPELGSVMPIKSRSRRVMRLRSSLREQLLGQAGRLVEKEGRKRFSEIVDTETSGKEENGEKAQIRKHLRAYDLMASICIREAAGKARGARAPP
ncbi:hypothetical protein HAX54_019066 [Datura stramonium]|uniref:Uncharacterized protein n=1 Tax=Datura stramonium TaxID=4076 RepID=A0ABS8UP52_DATST|nr:hypothetical protein [Datura stramonium]